MMNSKHPPYKKGTEAFFNIVMKGLEGLVDGDFFWDAVAEDAVFTFMYHVPGFVKEFKGRKAYQDWFEGYSNELHSADHLSVYKADGGVVILEYEVHGTVPHTGKAYDNRFCSIITIKDRKIIHWRDYMDSLAVLLANS